MDFNYSRNVFGAHYPLDTIGGRITATYIIAEMLAGNPLYSNQRFPLADLTSLSQAMQGYLGGGGSSPYAASCAGNIAACAIPTAATYTQLRQNYTDLLTYGLPSVGDTTLAPVVPTDAWRLISTRFPYLSTAQLNEVLYTTELPSGVPLDNGTGWARLNLYAAGGGYDAFRSDVTVNMNAALGGLNAFDIWSNNISGSGSLTKQGSGNLVLAGNNSYTGGTTIEAGTVSVTDSHALGSGAVTNNATLDIGSTTLAIGGTYTQSAASTLMVAVNGATNGNGSLVVTGTATATAGYNLALNVSNYIQNNATYKIIQGAAVGSAIAAPAISVLGNRHVTFAATTFSSDALIVTASRVANAFANDANPGDANARNVGNTLDTMTNPSADMSSVLNTMDGLSKSQTLSTHRRRKSQRKSHDGFRGRKWPGLR